MDELMTRKTPPATAGVPAKLRKAYPADGKDRLALVFAWGLGVLLVNLFWSKGIPGLGITLLSAAWYTILIWYRGKEGLKERSSRLLLAAVFLLSMTFSLFSNVWFRGWNLLALTGLTAVQLVQWTGMGEWFRADVVPKGTMLLFRGFFGYLPASLDTAKSIKGDRRMATMLLGLILALPLLALVLPLLNQADPYFAMVMKELGHTLQQLFGKAVLRLILGLLMLPCVFGLLYSLRHTEKTESKKITFTGTDPMLPAVVLAVMDLLYGFFILVQSAVLFGGPAYLERVSGLSYAEYARSGFFQLVFVAGLNLTLVLAAVQLAKKEEKGWGALRVLATALIVMSGVILGSAAYRMTLYVSVYGLSFKRVLTYWGMVMLAILFCTAFLKVWKANFSFFKVAFTVGVVGWLALNYCNVDRLVAKYNVTAYQQGQNVVIDLTYLAYDLSYDTLDVLEEIPNVPDLQARRQAAVLDTSDWRTWSFSAWRASR